MDPFHNFMCCGLLCGQFGVPLAAFQLIQERMVRMLATVQAMFLMVHRLTKLYEEGRMTHEQVRSEMDQFWRGNYGVFVHTLSRVVFFLFSCHCPHTVELWVFYCFITDIRVQVFAKAEEVAMGGG